MKQLLRSLLLVTAVSLLLVSPILAGQREGAFSLSPMVGYHVFEGDQRTDDSVSYGLAAGYNLTKNWAIEFDVRYTPTETDFDVATLIDQVYSFAIIFSFLAFEKFTPPQEDKLAYIGTRSYGIYLIHSPVLEVTSRLIYHLVPAVLAYQVLFQPILWVSGLGVPLLMMCLVDRSPLRRFYGILFG